MPLSKDYQEMFNLLGSKFTLPPLEQLQTAILIDILAALEPRERVYDALPPDSKGTDIGHARKSRRPKPSQ